MGTLPTAQEDSPKEESVRGFSSIPPPDKIPRTFTRSTKSQTYLKRHISWKRNIPWSPGFSSSLNTAKLEVLAFCMLNFLFLKEKRDFTKTLWLSGCSLQTVWWLHCGWIRNIWIKFPPKIHFGLAIKRKCVRYSRFGGHQPCKKGVAKIIITIYWKKTWLLMGTEETMAKTGKRFVDGASWLLKLVSKDRVFTKILVEMCSWIWV